MNHLLSRGATLLTVGAALLGLGSLARANTLGDPRRVHNQQNHAVKDHQKAERQERAYSYDDPTVHQHQR